MGASKMEDWNFDSFELLYSGAADKIKSLKSNLNLSKFVDFSFRNLLENSA